MRTIGRRALTASKEIAVSAWYVQMLIKYSIQLWIFLLRSPDFGIVAGLAVFVLLCASLPYMSILTGNSLRMASLMWLSHIPHIIPSIFKVVCVIKITSWSAGSRPRNRLSNASKITLTARQKKRASHLPAGIVAQHRGNCKKIFCRTMGKRLRLSKGKQNLIFAYKRL